MEAPKSPKHSQNPPLQTFQALDPHKILQHKLKNQKRKKNPRSDQPVQKHEEPETDKK